MHTTVNITTINIHINTVIRINTSIIIVISANTNTYITYI